MSDWIMITSDYALTNTASAQKFFDTSNGALSLETGVYIFEWFAYLTNMSATSGNAMFDILGTGTATAALWGHRTQGVDGATPLAVSNEQTSSSASSQTIANAVAASTNTLMAIRIFGFFGVSVAGTIVPSITLQTAAAALAKAGSFMVVTRLGDYANEFGDWS